MNDPSPTDESTNAVGRALSPQVVVFLDFDDVLAVHPDHISAKVVKILRSDNPCQTEKLWANLFEASLRGNLKMLVDEFAPQFVISSS